MWMPAHTTRPARARAFSAGRHELAGGGEDDRARRAPRAGARRCPRPTTAPSVRANACVSLVAGARERVHLASLVHGDLADLVRGRAEAVQTEAGRVAGEPQRAEPDQAAAQQRRRLRVAQLARDREAEPLVGDGQLGVAAVDVAAGELRVEAEVLALGAAVAAVAVGPPEPGHADAAIVLGDPDDLVAEYDWQLGGLDLAVAQVQVGAAHRARPDLQQQLARLRLGVRQRRLD